MKSKMITIVACALSLPLVAAAKPTAPRPHTPAQYNHAPAPHQTSHPTHK